MYMFTKDPRAEAAMPAMAAIGRLSRRSFLQAAAAAGALTVMGRAAAAPPAMKFVGASEAAVLQRLMEVTLPLSGSDLLPLSQVAVLPTLDGALLATMPPHILAGLKGGIGYWNDGPRAQFNRPFVDLNDEEAVRFCDAWANGSEVPQRALSVGLKKLIALAYFANPPTWAPLGYDGPNTRKRNIPSLGNAALPRS
ncbi:twin-arginine translocation signal domain-containing protein [Rhodoferax sp. GW822-FHT02A01]|uniref:twin-arginine translocation signal domain-containing protein n=1 Tax=Rhodoferax sp. GW822-FHT02A01 TaxID=3141537 RepID=UPI00315D2048